MIGNISTIRPYNKIPQKTVQKHQTENKPNSLLPSTTIALHSLMERFHDLKPLSALYRDQKGNKIRLWIDRLQGLIAGVMTPDQKLIIITGNRIKNGLNPEENAQRIQEKLAKHPNRLWELVYLPGNSSLYIWPSIKAAGREQYLPTHKHDTNRAQAFFKGKTQCEVMEGIVSRWV